MKRFAKRITRLYEQHADHVHMGKYVMHWVKWFYTGVFQFHSDVEHLCLTQLFSTLLNPIRSFISIL